MGYKIKKINTFGRKKFRNINDMGYKYEFHNLIQINYYLIILVIIR